MWVICFLSDICLVWSFHKTIKSLSKYTSLLYGLRWVWIFWKIKGWVEKNLSSGKFLTQKVHILTISTPNKGKHENLCPLFTISLADNLDWQLEPTLCTKSIQSKPFHSKKQQTNCHVFDFHRFVESSTNNRCGFCWPFCRSLSTWLLPWRRWMVLGRLKAGSGC